MMTHGCMLWGAALYNNGAVPVKRPRYRRELQHARRAAAAADRAAARPRRRSQARASCPFLDPLPRFEISQPGNVLRIFERGGRFRPEIGIPERLEEPGRPRTAPQRSAAWAPRTAPTPSSSACRRRGCSTRRSTSWAPTTIPATTAPAAAPPATSSTPTTARRSTPGPYAKFGNRGHELLDPTRRSPRTSRATRSSTSSRSAHPDQPVHRLPHPPRHERDEQLPRLHVVGRGDRRRADVSRRSRSIRPPRSSSQSQMSNPDEAAARGNWSDPEFLDERHRAEPAARSTPSSPTSTATAGSSAPSSRRTARATCSTTDGEHRPEPSRTEQLHGGAMPSRRAQHRSERHARGKPPTATTCPST